MTSTEVAELTEYLGRLYPKFTMSEEQRQVWNQKLAHTDIFTAKQAAGDAYAADLWAQPKLAELLAQIKRLKQTRGVNTDPDFSSAYVAQVQREEAEEEVLLADWTDQEYEDGKAEIMRHEPGVREFFAKLPAKGAMWRHLLCERYIHQRVYTFPGLPKVRVEGNRRVPELPAGVPITREEHWAVWP